MDAYDKVAALILKSQLFHIILSIHTEGESEGEGGGSSLIAKLLMTIQRIMFY